MKPTILLAAALILTASAVQAQAQSVTKRAVFTIGTSPPIQAKALTQRLGTNLSKEFFIAYGGSAFVTFNVRSNGSQQANWQAFFGNNSPCSGSTISATYQSFGCGAEIQAGAIIRVQVLSGGGQQVGVCCARLRFNIVDVNAPAVALKD